MTGSRQPQRDDIAERAAAAALAGRTELTVGAVAKLAGITVRTLHHYDEIGLLVPSGRSAAGHRAYGEADVARLQRILFYRELELPLDRIHQLVDDPGADELGHLRRQHELLGERITRLQRIRDAVATTMEAHTMSIGLTPEERLEVFGDNDPSKYSTEASERWGDTEAYRISRERIKHYSKDDWKRVMAEAEAIEAAFADALRSGEPPTGEVAMELAERSRLQITDAYYPLTHAMHANVADLYIEDERFTQHYDQRAEGLAQYVHDAIDANVARAGAASDSSG
ncbi:MAG: MerR family transcriptional regulator [Solirubrobacteraceae bacterium]|nr:MerR family transcriptional regulator [Solirubrobacteraceae bacterium]